jgi:hypothetical protein
MPDAESYGGGQAALNAEVIVPAVPAGGTAKAESVKH